MSRSRRALAKVAVVVLVGAGLCSAMASTASAGWFIESTELSGTAALATTAKVVEPFKLKVATVTVECTSSTLTGTSPEIKSPNLILATSLAFGECKASEPCSLATKTIGTLALLAEVSEKGLGVAALFKPKPSKTFAVIAFEGATCALSGSQSLIGTIAATFPLGQEENVLQLVRAKTGAGELKLGASEASLTGVAEIKLASGKAFEFLAVLPSTKFRMSVAPGVIGRRQRATFTITAAVAGTVERITIAESIAGSFREVGGNLARCERRAYAATERCSFEVEFDATEDAVLQAQLEDNERKFKRRSVDGDA